ncbi:efflux RND transporter periplasmic adaptor subunit [Taibaiella koreensis]|uniref:efflux RND transporter periplasmic adaptor subunit n=1 Tax=Taibaiella koreensis TaxID=1268548 RepID=UPI000E59A52B|nr:efflux RND transporter periplasmic adaptor subunit [Taibaiella koreensis]
MRIQSGIQTGKLKGMPYALLLLALSAGGCRHKEPPAQAKNLAPVISNNGTSIDIPDPSVDTFFKTESVGTGDVTADMSAPGKVAAAVVSSSQGKLILFDNPDLASTYSQLTQNMNNITQKKNIVAQKAAVVKQKQIEVQRYEDLAAHGAGTGKDVSDAKTDLLLAESDLKMAQSEVNTEQAGIMEHEALLKSGGFNPGALSSAGPGSVYITCDIAESQISKIKAGTACTLKFPSFPNEQFKGSIDNIADVIDNSTRMVKVRITMANNDNRIKAGMFAMVGFGINEGNNNTIPATSLVTVQGKNYVFVKKSDTRFERREVNTGQQLGDRVIVYSGLQAGESVAVTGVMQLKGLSFGY